MPAALSQEVIIAANPTAGARSVDSPVARLVDAVAAAGMRPSVQTDLLALAAEVETADASGDLRAVIAAGGDGTAAAVANLIGEDIPLIPFPLGTENLLARYFGVRADPRQICEILNRGSRIQMDAGLANGRMFLLMASCGIDADVVRRVQAQRRGHIDHLTYVQPILESLQSYAYPHLRVAIEDENGTSAAEEVVGKWAFVINVPNYAGGLRIVREAVGTDGLLDVCVFKRGSVVYDLVYLTGILLGQHQNWSDCHVRQARRLRIEADEPVPYQLDGDFGGELPLHIEVAARRVTYLVPPSSNPNR